MDLLQAVPCRLAGVVAGIGFVDGFVDVLPTDSRKKSGEVSRNYILVLIRCFQTPHRHNFRLWIGSQEFPHGIQIGLRRTSHHPMDQLTGSFVLFFGLTAIQLSLGHIPITIIGPLLKSRIRNLDAWPASVAYRAKRHQPLHIWETFPHLGRFPNRKRCFPTDLHRRAVLFRDLDLGFIEDDVVVRAIARAAAVPIEVADAGDACGKQSHARVFIRSQRIGFIAANHI